MSDKVIVVILFSSLFVRELWMLLPENEATFDPFPLYDIQITRQTYVGFACWYGSMIMIAYCFCQFIESQRIVMIWWFYLQALEFVDYFFTYNTAWFNIFGFGIGITIVKFSILFSIIIYRLWRT